MKSEILRGTFELAMTIIKINTFAEPRGNFERPSRPGDLCFVYALKLKFHLSWHMDSLLTV